LGFRNLILLLKFIKTITIILFELLGYWESNIFNAIRPKHKKIQSLKLITQPHPTSRDDLANYNAKMWLESINSIAFFAGCISTLYNLAKRCQQFATPQPRTVWLRAPVNFKLLSCPELEAKPTAATCLQRSIIYDFLSTSDDYLNVYFNIKYNIAAHYLIICLHVSFKLLPPWKSSFCPPPSRLQASERVRILTARPSAWEIYERVRAHRA